MSRARVSSMSIRTDMDSQACRIILVSDMALPFMAQYLCISFSAKNVEGKCLNVYP